MQGKLQNNKVDARVELEIKEYCCYNNVESEN